MSSESGFAVALFLSNGIIPLKNKNIQELIFIEDIFLFCMHGKMIFEDHIGFVEKGPLVGGERIEIVYTGKDSVRYLTFDIIKVKEISPISSTMSSRGSQICIYFVDTSYKNLVKTKYSKSWNKKNNKYILDDILKNMVEGDSDNEKIILKRYDNTNDVSSLISPYWTPMENILWLNERTLSVPSQDVGEDVGGYLYYSNTYWDKSETKNKYNNFSVAWKSINNLFSFPVDTSSKSDFIEKESFVFTSDQMKYNKDDSEEKIKILDWSLSGIDFSMNKRMQGGHMLGYNFDGKSLIDRKYKYTKKNDTQNVDVDILKKITGLGNTSLFPDISDRDAEVLLTSNTSTNVMDNIMYYYWLRSYATQQVLIVTVEGDEKRFAGKMIKNVIWDNFGSEDIGGNKNMIGSYLIKSITHSFGIRSGYNQQLVLMKNGYYRSDVVSLVDFEKNNVNIPGGGILKT
jgi:hypothetical protein